MIERAICPTCGSPVVVASSDEGTNHYVPANAPEHTEALLALEAARNALHDACLKIGSTEGFRATFDAINAALNQPAFAAIDREALIERVLERQPPGWNGVWRWQVEAVLVAAGVIPPSNQKERRT